MKSGSRNAAVVLAVVGKNGHTVVVFVVTAVVVASGRLLMNRQRPVAPIVVQYLLCIIIGTRRARLGLDDDAVDA